ncbi:MAG: hypothetical protein Wins2KO_10640 [Winogradskyella sp.]
MKQLFLCTVLFICSVNYLNAQESTNPPKSSIDFGLRFGNSFYDIRSNGNVISDFNLYVGAFAEKSLSEKWALRIETNYSGSSVMQFPILLKYKFNNKFEIYGGPQLDFSFEQKNTLEELRNKRFGASLVFGAQYNISTKWFIEARYIYGLSNQYPIFNGSGIESTFTNKQSFNFGIGYKF